MYKRQFVHAVQEINSQFDINLTFKEIKTGRAVTDLIFKFKPVQQEQFYDIFLDRKRTKVKDFKKKTHTLPPPTVDPNQQELPNLDQKTP